MISAKQLREKYLEFFTGKNHVRLPSASLIPENDPTVLFTTAGMHPLVPYLLGETHPAGTRLTSVQKCLRTADIDDVGDPSHNTFFEMLGNWSLGDYFKAESIPWSWEFLTDPKWLAIDPERLAVSVFAGDDNAPRDEEAAALWEGLGMPRERIYYLPAEQNWWSAGPTGPCGPDTEIFYIVDQPPCGPDCSPACECGRYREIWNNVFMQYNHLPDGRYVPLEKKCVDTGMGVERTLATLYGTKSSYETELFTDILACVEELSGKKYGESPEVTRAMRIIADHIRSATFMLGDEKGITPSNVDQGYVLRRLIRRAIRFAMQLGIPEHSLSQIAQVVIAQYQVVYPELERNAAFILEQLRLEEERFQRTLRQGINEFEKLARQLSQQSQVRIDGSAAFRLYDTYGFPIEMTMELASERGLSVDDVGFDEAFKRHQQLSQAGAEQRFKGGLADSSEATTRLHTATHLLHAALRQVLGEEVKQRGSNITPERLRFDFSFGRKMTPEEVAQVEALVNDAIAQALSVTMEEMTVDQAREQNAIGLFEARYGDQVKVYTMGNVSKEICGGPHAGNTAELEGFKIQKEEASSAGVRRIRAQILARD